VLKYINLCYVFDTSEVFVDENNMNEVFEGIFVKNVLNCKNVNESMGIEISEDEVEGVIKESMLDDGSGECEDWDEMLNKFKEGVKKLGKGGRWFSWGVEYDRNILYVVGE